MADRSPDKWTVISGVAALAALVIPFVIEFLTHQAKSLSVATVSRAALVDLRRAGDPSITLTYNGTPVSYLTAITMEIRNDGSIPIQQSDFEHPLLIRFPHPTSVIAATPGETDPTDIHPVVELNAGVISVDPLLLNPGDRFRLTVQLLSDFEEPFVEGRISGVRAISRQIFRVQQRSVKPWMTGTLGFVFFLAYSYLSGLLVGTLWLRRIVPEMFVGMLLFALAGGLLLQLTIEDLTWSRAQRGFLVVPLVILSVLVLLLGRRRGRSLTAVPGS